MPFRRRMRINGGSSFWTDARIPLLLIVGLYSHNGEWVVNEHSECAFLCCFGIVFPPIDHILRQWDSKKRPLEPTVAIDQTLLGMRAQNPYAARAFSARHFIVCDIDRGFLFVHPVSSRKLN